MQQDPVHTQTHSRTHRDSEGTEDSHATGSTPHPAPHSPPFHPPAPYTHFYADSGKKEKFAAHIWSLFADSQRPELQQSHRKGHGERSGPRRWRQHQWESTGRCVGKERGAEEGRRWPPTRVEGGFEYLYLSLCHERSSTI